MTDWPELGLRTILLPILVVQALLVRKRALRLPEALGPRRGTVGNGPRLNLLIIGDSAAAGVGVAHQDQALAGQLVANLAADFTVAWRLEAETGADTSAILERLSRLDRERFDIVVTSLGVNDVTGLVTCRQWIARQQRLAELTCDRFSARLIVTSGLPPMGRFPLLPQPLRWVLGRQATRFDKALGRLAAASAARVHIPMDLPLDSADMAADGYHPGAAIYTGWAGLFAAAIRMAVTPSGRLRDDAGRSQDGR